MFNFFKNKSRKDIPDFSEIDSKEKAVELYKKGKLEKLFLVPLEYGGVDNELNFVFVPLGVPEIKQNIDFNIITGLIEESKVSQYEARPKYIGNSFIPGEIVIRAYDPGEFTTTITIWG